MFDRIKRLWTLPRRYAAARLAAEALAWHHGARGVAYAETLAADDSVSDEVWRHNRLVARLTAQRHRYLSNLDTATRYEAWEDWTRRRGQMLWPDLTPEQ